MRGRLSPRGYTIVEVMVFLAVSGFMFLLATVFISGKQATSEFRQSVNDANSQIQQVINDVSDGFYPNSTDFSCTTTSTGLPNLTAATNQQQGTNLGCVLMGKIIQFQPQDSTGTVNNGNYNIYAVVARQYAPNSTNQPPTDFSDAQPEVITAPVDLTDFKTFEWGSQVTKVLDGATSIGAIGFFGSFGQQPGGDLQSGAQITRAMAIPNITAGMPELGADGLAAAFNVSTEGTAMDNKLSSEPNPDITICFDSGKGQFGSITIGGTIGQNLSTTVKIGDAASQVGC